MRSIIQLKRIGIAIMANKLSLHFSKQIIYSFLIYPLWLWLKSRRYLLSS